MTSFPGYFKALPMFRGLPAIDFLGAPTNYEYEHYAPDGPRTCYSGSPIFLVLM